MRYENTDKSAGISTFKDLRQWRKERKSKQKDLSFQVPLVEKRKKRFYNVIGWSRQSHGLDIPLFDST